MSKELNETQNASVGMMVGMIEVCDEVLRAVPCEKFAAVANRLNQLSRCSSFQVLLLQPFNYAKNMKQQKKPISLNPVTMYRGVGANCVNMGSCTMLQFVVGGKLKNLALAGQERDLSVGEEMACGIGAGAFSALVGAPLELIMIQQQRKGGNAITRVQNILERPSNIGRGFLGCSIREALWTCGYLSIPPVVRRTLMTTYPETFDTNDKARVPAALLGGLFACYLTHPVDTIKTCMQGDIERSTYGSFLETGKILYGESGVRAFFRGATFRYGRMVCAVFIMDLLRENIGRMMYPQAYANS